MIYPTKIRHERSHDDLTTEANSLPSLNGINKDIRSPTKPRKTRIEKGGTSSSIIPST
jgi:hypothetical protein